MGSQKVENEIFTFLKVFIDRTNFLKDVFQKGEE